MDPEEMTSTSSTASSPRRMMAPVPKSLWICSMVMLSAFIFSEASLMRVVVVVADFFFAII